MDVDIVETWKSNSYSVRIAGFRLFFEGTKDRAEEIAAFLRESIRSVRTRKDLTIVDDIT